MKYAVEMGTGTMIYDISSFTEIGSCIPKLMGGCTHTHRQYGDRISLLLFFQNKGSRLKSRLLLRRKHT
jgi:hypothetical protein